MKTWETIDGTELKIKDMETSHIKNCIAYLKRNPRWFAYGVDLDDMYFEIDEETTEEYIKTLKKELKKRNVQK